MAREAAAKAKEAQQENWRQQQQGKQQKQQQGKRLKLLEMNLQQQGNKKDH